MIRLGLCSHGAPLPSRSGCSLGVLVMIELTQRVFIALLVAALLLVTLGSGLADAHGTKTTFTVQDLRQITTLIRDSRLNKEAFGR